MNNNSQEQTITIDYLPDLKEIISTVWRHRVVMITVMAITTVIGLGAILLKPVTYRAVGTIMVEDSALDLKDFEDITEGAKFDTMTIQTEVKVLSSGNLAKQTIQSAKLAETEEFGSPEGDDRAVVRKFMGNLSVGAQGTSRIIEVAFESEDPELAAKVANAHIDSYFQSQVNFKKQRVEQLGQWFESKVKDLKSDVIKKSRAVGDYRAKEGLIVGTGQQELVYQRITDIAAQLTATEGRKFDAEAKLSAIESAEEAGFPEAITSIVQSPLIQALKEQESTASQQVGALQAQFGAQHPRLMSAQRQLARVQNAVATEVTNIKTSLANEQVTADKQEALLKKRLEGLQEDANELRIKMITLKSLQVEQDASQKLLDNFLANYENIQSQVSFARPDAVLVSSAVTPAYPAPPGKKLLLLIVLVIATFLGLAAVFVMDIMRGGIRNFEDIRNLNQKPVGIMPNAAQPIVAMQAVDNSAYKEAVKRIYMTGLLNHPARTLLITSALPKEGRTTLTASLAHYLMSIEHRVAIIDADFMRTTLSDLTSEPSNPGFTDVLNGRASLDDAIGSTPDGLTVIRAGREALSSPDALRSGKFSELMEQLKQRYAYVLIDSGPLLAHAEASIIASHTDGIIIVTEWMKTSQKNMSNMFATLSQSPTPILGVVINRVDIDKYKTVTSGSDFLLPKMPNAA